MFPTRRITTSGGDKFRDEFSLAFDGTNDYVQLPPSNTLFTGTNMTVSAWFTIQDGDDTVLFHNQKAPGSSHFSIIVNYGDGHSTDGSVGLITWNGSSHDYLRHDAGIHNDGKWHHIVATTTSSAQSLYLDGVLVDSDSSVFGTNASSDNSYIGAYNGASSFLQGNVSETAVYTSALTAGQVKTIYNGREPYNHKEGVASGSLKAWYRMGDGLENHSGTTIYDQSNNSNNGTMTNMAADDFEGNTP